MYYLLTEEHIFPDVLEADEDGLLAFGGDLSPDRVLKAYQSGIFPWFNEDEEIMWWCPNPRFVLYPQNLKVSKSTRKLLKSNSFHFTENKCFEEVIDSCAKITRSDQEGTWITKAMKETYLELYHRGIAKSVEVWKGEELVGGLYGIELGEVFCGESMFSKVSNASKCGFSYFVEKYQAEYKLIDCQVYSHYLESLGADYIPLEEYLVILKSNLVEK